MFYVASALSLNLVGCFVLLAAGVRETPFFIAWGAIVGLYFGFRMSRDEDEEVS